MSKTILKVGCRFTDRKLTMPQIELYRSSSGDCWSLCKNESGKVYVVHEPNEASGGKQSIVDVRSFLAKGDGPEQQALLQLIGSLVDSQGQ
jgi:hypothetical protein